MLDRVEREEEEEAMVEVVVLWVSCFSPGYQLLSGTLEMTSHYHGK